MVRGLDRVVSGEIVGERVGLAVGEVVCSLEGDGDELEMDVLLEDDEVEGWFERVGL